MRGFLVLSVLVLTSPLATSAQTVARSLDKWLGVQARSALQTEPDGRCAPVRACRTCSAEWIRSKVDALVDYAGLADQRLQDHSDGAISLGTTVTGTVGTHGSAAAPRSRSSCPALRP